MHNGAMDDDELRAMALHRGLRLAKSRRRKPGGDFGRYGLRDGDGGAVFGFDGDALTASAEAVAAYLRHAARANWSTSAAGLPKRQVPAANAAPEAKPKPPPRPKLRTLPVANLFDRLPAAVRAEAFTRLFDRDGLSAERIVSLGQVTPQDAPMVQDRDEWVVLLRGAARLRVEGHREVELKPGDHVWIARGQPHWVTWTDPEERSVWLALHFA